MASVLLICSPITYAQEKYPTKVIRILTATPGSNHDWGARITAQELSPRIGQRVIVENRGSISTEIVAKDTPPDGYTILFYGAYTWLQPLLSKVNWDPVEDLAPITLAISSPNVLVVHPSLPVKSVKDLIALAKARPATLNYGGSTSGSTTHLAVELFKALAGVDLVRVPYKGQGSMFTALMAGEVQLTITSGAALLPHVKAGKMRALAVTGARPSAMFPGFPTVASTLPGYESETIFAVFVPAATPAAIIGQLQQEIARVLNKPEVKERCFTAGNEVVASTPQQLVTVMKADMARMGKVIKDAGIRGE